MQITANSTPFLADLFVPTDKTGARHCVVVVKGTFEVEPDGTARPAEQQEPFVYADQHHGDPGSTSVRYECEFVPVKPKVDILVNGAAVASGSRAVEHLQVALLGPGLRKHADVRGDRFWTEGVRGIQPSPPRPFVRMPLVWERGFGGSDHRHPSPHLHGSELRNLVGRGFHLDGARESILGQPLPNIERPDAPITHWSDKPEPIGFNVVGRGWQPRIRYAGTYDEAWIEHTRPFLPADFDERYFQSAPADQQIDDLAGGERFACLNMTEDSHFLVEVPPLAMPIRFMFENRTRLVAGRADTLIIEPEARRLTLIWRAGVRVGRKVEMLREIRVGLGATGPSPHKPRYRSLTELFAAQAGPP